MLSLVIFLNLVWSSCIISSVILFFRFFYSILVHKSRIHSVEGLSI
uniref:Uncharacterized protein n=1 Tax=virus sp. ctML55 TaxID=2827627 RepID=A0A8S5RIH6_9VIRU|nr:MAG TPA: Protein of unknown function (DUF2633) [virus sp. ctML55]